MGCFSAASLRGLLCAGGSAQAGWPRGTRVPARPLCLRLGELVALAGAAAASGSAAPAHVTRLCHRGRCPSRVMWVPARKALSEPHGEQASLPCSAGNCCPGKASCLLEGFIHATGASSKTWTHRLQMLAWYQWPFQASWAVLDALPCPAG